MRHLSRTHGTSISWLHEQCQGDGIQVEYVTTTLMAADIYTKALTDAEKWINFCEQINLVEPADLGRPHIHALHALLLTESRPVAGNKIHGSTQLLPEELQGWSSSLGWHEKGDIHEAIVREGKLYGGFAGDGQ